VSDDFVAEQQLPLGSAITVVRFIRIVGIVRVIGRRRVAALQSLLGQLGGPTIAVSPPGIEWLER
jgi:hypothetical protein